jgi:SAM-dependent methyltransferase
MVPAMSMPLERLRSVAGRLVGGATSVVHRTDLAAARQHRSFDAMSAILGWMLGLAGGRAFPLGERSRGRALEIGTGKFLAHAVGPRLCGYERVLTIDRERQATPALAREAMASPVLARRFLSAWAPHDAYVSRLKRVRQTRFEPEALAAAGIEYRAPADALSLLSADERFDLVFSYTVLEHVPPHEVPGLLSASRRLLAPGGVALHFIDLEDHADPVNRPFDFLREPGKWTDENCGVRGNRIRFSRWRRLLDESGLKWNYPYAPVRRDAPLPEPIAPDVPNEGEDDLRTTALLAVAVSEDGTEK